MQKMTLKLFEHYKVVKPDGSLDLPAAIAGVKAIIKDPEWLKVTESALTACDQYSDKHLTEAQSKEKFTKEECSVKFSLMAVCMEVYNFGVSLLEIQLSKL